jgi:hypothetical protein
MPLFVTDRPTYSFPWQVEKQVLVLNISYGSLSHSNFDAIDKIDDSNANLRIIHAPEKGLRVVSGNKCSEDRTYNSC